MVFVPPQRLHSLNLSSSRPVCLLIDYATIHRYIGNQMDWSQCKSKDLDIPSRKNVQLPHGYIPDSKFGPSLDSVVYISVDVNIIYYGGFCFL